MRNCIAFFLTVLVLIPLQAFGTCGDGACEVSENTENCRIDCKLPIKQKETEYTINNGPAVRASPSSFGLLVATVAIQEDSSVLQLTILDDAFKPSFSKILLSRPLTGRGELGNPHPIQAPDGSILIAFRDHDLSDKNNPVYRLRIIRSQDGGHNWDYVEDNGNNSGLIDAGLLGLWEPFVYFDANNDLRVVYAKERSEKVCQKQAGIKQDIVTKVSRDWGRTWIDETVAASDGVSREGVPSVSRLRDGSYVMAFESWQSSTCGRANPNLLIRSMQSRDGIKWGKRAVVYDPYAQAQFSSIATWPFVSTIQDGRIIVTFTSNYRTLASESASSATPEKTKTFDTFLLMSNGSPSFEKLTWDTKSLMAAFSYDKTSSNSNRYSSFAISPDNYIVVFSGLPNRFIIFKLQ